MPKPNPPKLSPHDMAHKWVQPDETILWEGKPKHCFFIDRWDVWLQILAIPFFLFWGITLSVELQTAFMFFLLLPFTLICVFPNILRYYKLRGAWYLITDQRLVVIHGWRVEFWEYPNIPYLERSERQLGVTTLYLQPQVACSRYSFWETNRGALVNLSDEDIDRASGFIEARLYKGGAL